MNAHILEHHIYKINLYKGIEANMSTKKIKPFDKGGSILHRAQQVDSEH